MSDYTYERYLDEQGSLTYRNVGVSMMPMLKQDRDLFTVVKKGDARCKKYDVVLYRRPPNKYVLHRVIKVRQNDYVILGDNCINKEYGITDNDIIGVMISFVHNGKEYKTSDLRYRIYVFWRCHTAPIRIFLKKLKYKLKRLIKKTK